LQQNKHLTVQSKNYGSPRISSEIPDCSMPMTFDQYNYCSLGCAYCFAYGFKSNNPVYKNKQIPLKSINADDMIAAIQGKPCSSRGKRMYEHFYKRKFVLHWGGLADPFCMFENENREGLKLITALGDMNYPTLFSFKGATIFNKDFVNIFERFAHQGNFAFQVSIVANNDEVSRQLEIGAPITSRRIAAIKMLHDMGYWTILRLRPFIMGISDVGLDELLDRSLKAGINGVSVEWFALDSRCNPGMKKRFNWMGKLMGTDNLQKYYSELSPGERGGYMRLNRRVKDIHMKKIYQFCVKNNLVCGVSDPDFKELNTSGSCCGMPDNFPKNRGLENWTRNQLTYHLKMARQQYHKDGTLALLYFHLVYGDESYLEDVVLTHDHVSEVTLPIAARYVRTYRLILQKHWNNLNSPANPRNYLHGKVVPIGPDLDGNLIYRYQPLEYEDRWKREGIDLTR
jgi:DNA repair photolyase